MTTSPHFFIVLCAWLYLSFSALLAAEPIAEESQKLALHSVSAIAPVFPKKRMVWVHSMVCFPLELRWIYPYHPEGYGADAPLLQELGLTKRTGMGWSATDLRLAKEAGVDGMAVDIFTSGCENYLKDADTVGGIVVAPCLDLSCEPVEKKEAAALSTIVRYCQYAARYPSAARVNDAFVIFTYGTEQLPPEAWGRIRVALAAQNLKTYWVYSCDTDGKLNRPKTFPRAAMERYLEPFEAAYCFGGEPMAGQSREALLAFYAEKNKPFFGGMMAGYYRVNGGYRDSRATAVYREAWEKKLQEPPAVNWACIATWNDYSEHTNIAPSTDWSFTRAELTRWYAARFRGEDLPWKDARLYLSTPKHIYRDGSAWVAEALALNGSDKPARLGIELVDGAGKPFGKPIAVDCQPRSLATAVIPLTVTDFPAGRFLRAKAKILVDSSRVGVAACVSAPICVYDETSMPGIPVTYLSVAAHRSVRYPLSCKLEGSPLKDPLAKATVNAHPDGFVKYLDLLHNGELVYRDHQSLTLERPVPKRTSAGQLVSGYAWGFFQARVVDQDLNVGYSDPVYVAPEGDLDRWERFPMDEGSGENIRDDSAYGKVGLLKNVEWVTPGFGGKGACLRFNGKNSVVDLRSCKTPDGPMTLRMAVRPVAGAGGFLFGDRSGQHIVMLPDGRVKYVRNTAQGFVSAVSKTKLMAGEWHQLAFDYDGGMGRILINGTLDAEAASGPNIPSGGHVLGYNPYGGGYFTGDIDELELRIRKPKAPADNREKKE